MLVHFPFSQRFPTVPTLSTPCCQWESALVSSSSENRDASLVCKALSAPRLYPLLNLYANTDTKQHLNFRFKLHTPWVIQMRRGEEKTPKTTRGRNFERKQSETWNPSSSSCHRILRLLIVSLSSLYSVYYKAVVASSAVPNTMRIPYVLIYFFREYVINDSRYSVLFIS